LPIGVCAESVQVRAAPLPDAHRFDPDETLASSTNEAGGGVAAGPCHVNGYAKIFSRLPPSAGATIDSVTVSVEVPAWDRAELAGATEGTAPRGPAQAAANAATIKAKIQARLNTQRSST